MENSIYKINKGINSPIEFRGLKAQYITYLAIGLVGLLLLSAIAYIAGLPTYLLVGSVGVVGFWLFSTIYKYNRKYGQYGLMKKMGYKRIPEAIVCRSRHVFTSLKNKETKRPSK